MIDCHSSGNVNQSISTFDVKNCRNACSEEAKKKKASWK